MSLRGQFFLSVILALLVGLSLEGAVACWQAQRSVENEMHKALDAADRMVDNALLSLPLAGQDDYLARLVASFDGNRHVRVTLIAWGRVLAVSRLAPPEPAPGWFTRLLAIGEETRRDVSPRLPGHLLLVQSDPHNEISETWEQLRDGAAVLLLFSLLVLGLLHLVMARLGGHLRKLNAGFGALGGGDYAARVPVAGPRELAELAQDFNRMAGRLGALEEANRRMAAQMQAIQEEERADLARDLHDEMGPFLFAVRVDAEAIATASQGAARERAHAITEAVSHIQTHVRLILRQLRPEAEVALPQALANLLTFWKRHHPGIAIVLDAIRADGFGAEIDAAIFRLVQEGLTNAARHSGARHVWVTLAADEKAIRVAVEDDGKGFASAPGESGLAGVGLAGMRERLAAVSGRLRLEARPGGGARLAAEIPRQAAHAAMVPA